MSSISELVNKHRPDLGPLEDLYKHYHANPELSNQESETAAHLKDQLSKISSDLVIKTNIGGHGLVAILRNGDGPTVLLRADFDALPVEEQTDLPYKSTKRMKDAEGIERPVMHACGHDMHITCLLGATKLLVSAKDSWAGTLLLCFQPAEERGTGAKAMVDDGMYDEKRHAVPVPDVAIGGHVMPLRAGVLATRRGTIAASADSMRVTLYGRGSHSSMPERAVDPVVMAASTVMRLQTIISRETHPGQAAVLTVASIHSGDAENVIPSEAKLAIDTRSVTQENRDRILRRIKDVIRHESSAAMAVREPTFEMTRSFPLTINDEDVTAKLEETFAAHFGEEKNQYNRNIIGLSGSEDFGILASSVDKPYCFFVYGGAGHDLWDGAESEGTLSQKIPGNHSSTFAPVIHPTMQTGLDGYAAGALTFLIKS